MKRFRYLSLALLALCAITFVNAADADASGLWKWSVTTPNGQFESSAKLTQKDGKLDGVVSSRRGDSPISQGSVKDSQIAFNVEREMGGNKVVSKYEGKISGDAIDGTILMPGRDGGEPRKVEWKATRAK